MLPSSEGYRHCSPCKRWIASSNAHCEKCKACTSKVDATSPWLALLSSSFVVLLIILKEYAVICHATVKFQDGRTYVHCNLCQRCVKPSYQHCEACARCKLPDHQCQKPGPLEGHKQGGPKPKKKRKQKGEKIYYGSKNGSGGLKKKQWLLWKLKSNKHLEWQMHLLKQNHSRKVWSGNFREWRWKFHPWFVGVSKMCVW